EVNGTATAAGAAGGHYDPQNTGKHGTPWGDGHLGDLPALYVDGEGNAYQPVLAPRLKQEADIKGRALMVHAGGDNHADHQTPRRRRRPGGLRGDRISRTGPPNASQP